MEELYFALIISLVAGLGASAVTDYHSNGKKAIRECEKTLPRDQHCVITAVPEKTK